MPEKLSGQQLQRAFLHTAASSFDLCRLVVRALESIDPNICRDAVSHLDQAERHLRAFETEEFATHTSALLGLAIQTGYELPLAMRRSLWAGAITLYEAGDAMAEVLQKKPIVIKPIKQACCKDMPSPEDNPQCFCVGMTKDDGTTCTPKKAKGGPTCACPGNCSEQQPGIAFGDDPWSSLFPS